MFENSLKEKFETIFEISKVTYDQPGESKEQECLFINVEKCLNKVVDGHFYCRVRGKGFVFAQAGKIPFGYFSKKINKSDPALTKDLHFSEIEESENLYENIVQRSFTFVYFFNSQYNPVVGNIEDIEIEAIP